MVQDDQIPPPKADSSIYQAGNSIHQADSGIYQDARQMINLDQSLF